MSHSENMEIFYSVFIHKAPASLSIPDFEQTMEALFDEVMVLPVVQENFMNVEMIFQTDKADNHTAAFGLGSRPPTVMVALRTRTAEELKNALAAPEARKIFQKGKDFGIQSSGFAFSVVPKIDDGPAPDNGVEIVFVYDAPRELATSETHIREFDELMRDCALLPAVKKNHARLEMWQSTDIMDQDIRDFGYSTKSRPTLYRGILKDFDAAKEVLTDWATQRFFASAAEGCQQFDPKKYGYAFVANVVTKLDKRRK